MSAKRPREALSIVDGSAANDASVRIVVTTPPSAAGAPFPASEELAVVGATTALGEWGRGVPLALTPNAERREWTATIHVPQDAPLEFRFVRTVAARLHGSSYTRIEQVDAARALPYSVVVPAGLRCGHNPNAGPSTSVVVTFSLSTADLRWVPADRLCSAIPTHPLFGRTLLRLTVYPFRNDRAFHGTTSEGHRALQVAFRPRTVSVAPSPHGDWSWFCAQPTVAGASAAPSTSATKPAHRPPSPLPSATRQLTRPRASVTASGVLQCSNGPSEEASEEDSALFPAIIDPLESVAVVESNATDGGALRTERTMPCWTCTALLDAMDGAVLVFTGEGGASAVLMPGMLQGRFTGSAVTYSHGGADWAPLFVAFNVIRPFTHADSNLRCVRTADKHDLRPRSIVGHRGLGATFHRDPKEGCTKFQENTLESFAAAHSRGCEYVELDVMLSRDRVPVIYHDGMLGLRSECRQEIVATSRPFETKFTGRAHPVDRAACGAHSVESVVVGVHQLSARQLRTLVVEPRSTAVMPRNHQLRQLMLKHWRRIVSLRSSLSSTVAVSASSLVSGGDTRTHDTASSPTSAVAGDTFPGHVGRQWAVNGDYHRSTANNKRCSAVGNGGALPVSGARAGTPGSTDGAPRFSPQDLDRLAERRLARNVRLFHGRVPLLSDLFEHLPPALGLMIEIKYPTQPDGDSHLHEQTSHFEVNGFVDVILAVLFDAQQRFGDRQVCFCSFDPDVCIALQRKQARHHVVFLSVTCDTPVDIKDYRCAWIEGALQFAAAEKFAGVSIASSTLLGSAEQQKLPKVTRSAEAFAVCGSSAPRGTEQTSDEALGAVLDLDGTPARRRWRSFDPSAGQGIVARAEAMGLVVWTWGAWSRDHYWCLAQRELMGVAGVIADRVPMQQWGPSTTTATPTR